MRKFAILAISFILFSCAANFSSNFSPYFINYFDLNKEYTIKIGFPIAKWEEGSFNHAIQKELIYTGIEHENLKILYREYYLNGSGEILARNPFFINLNYDLSLSKIIAYRKLRIKILSADNEQIKFIILKAPKEYPKHSVHKQSNEIKDIFGD